MAGHGDAEGVTTSMGELSVETAPSSSGTEIAEHANGGDVAAAEDDDIWDDASDSPGHDSNLDREWIHRQNQFHKVYPRVYTVSVVNSNCSSAIFVDSRHD